MLEKCYKCRPVGQQDTRDSQTRRQTDSQTVRQTDSETERQRERSQSLSLSVSQAVSKPGILLSIRLAASILIRPGPDWLLICGTDTSRLHATDFDFVVRLSPRPELGSISSPACSGQRALSNYSFVTSDESANSLK